MSAATLKAAIFYFACVFAVGMVCGPLRVIWLEPVLGMTIAVALEMPVLLAAMWFAAKAAPRWASLSSKWPSYLGVGVIALILQQAADLAVGFGLRGATVQSQIAYFATLPGWIYAAALLVFCLMPLIRHLQRPRTTAEAN